MLPEYFFSFLVALGYFIPHYDSPGVLNLERPVIKTYTTTKPYMF
jgi:hypothetical protein